MSTNTKTNRELGRTPKHSTLFSNVTAIVFAPASGLQTENSFSDHGTVLRSSPTELFEAFKERNYSSMRKRLNESLEEMRLAGWIAPCTLLIKGPLEELEVIKEAWRRHFLRSPEGLLIRDIGVVASVEMEIVQQSPFLPLARALYEAIAALNDKDQPATQESIVDFLFEAYQYVHMPKLNVIHGCLGILIKEEKIYHNGTGYHVSSPPGPPSGDKLSENPTTNEVSPKNDDIASTVSKNLMMCTSCQVALKGDFTKDDASQKERTGEVKNRCTECGRSAGGRTDSQVEESMENEIVAERTSRKSRKKPFGRGTPDKNSNSSSKDSDPKEASEIRKSTEKEKKGSTKEKRRQRSNSHSNSVTSETTSSASEQSQKKNAKEKLNHEGKKGKRNVFSQMSCFISKTFSTADVCNEQETTSIKVEETVPLSSGAPLTEEDVGVTPSVSLAEKSSKQKCDAQTVETEDLKHLRDSVVRSRSFVQPAKRRTDNPSRSVPLTANTEKTAEDVVRLHERGAHVNQTEFARRSVMFRRSMPPLSSSGTFPVGIVRPLTNSHTTDCRTAPRSNSSKADTSRKSSASGTPSSTPKMKEKAFGHARKGAQPQDIPKVTEGYTSFRTMENQIYCVETPLKQLHSSAKHFTPSSSKFRESVPPKTKYFAGPSHLVPGGLHKKTSRISVPFPAGESTHAPSSSTKSHHHSCKPMGKLNADNWTNHVTGVELSTTHEQMGGLLDSQDICLEAVSSSECSERPYHAAGERFLEVKPFSTHQFVDGEFTYDDSLTFIGII